MTSRAVADVGRIIGEHLADIAPLFKPGTKLTLLARCQEITDGSRDMVVTDDVLADAIQALTIRMEHDA